MATSPSEGLNDRYDGSREETLPSFGVDLVVRIEAIGALDHRRYGLQVRVDPFRRRIGIELRFGGRLSRNTAASPSPYASGATRYSRRRVLRSPARAPQAALARNDKSSPRCKPR